VQLPLDFTWSKCSHFCFKHNQILEQKLVLSRNSQKPTTTTNMSEATAAFETKSHQICEQKISFKYKRTKNNNGNKHVWSYSCLQKLPKVTTVKVGNKILYTDEQNQNLQRSVVNKKRLTLWILIQCNRLETIQRKQDNC